MHAKQILIRLLVIYCTFNIRQSNKEVCFHLNSQPCSQAVIIFDADHLKYKQYYRVYQMLPCHKSFP